MVKFRAYLKAFSLSICAFLWLHFDHSSLNLNVNSRLSHLHSSYFIQPSSIHLRVMGKFRSLTTAEKTNVVRLHGMGKSQKEIAKIYSINQSSVSRILGAKTSLMTKRSGRPRKTTKKTDSLIIREVKKNPFISAREIKNSTPLLQNVSERTIWHRLSKDLKMPARKPRKKPLLTKKMRLKRLSFCKQHLRWTTEQCNGKKGDVQWRIPLSAGLFCKIFCPTPISIMSWNACVNDPAGET